MILCSACTWIETDSVSVAKIDFRIRSNSGGRLGMGMHLSKRQPWLGGLKVSTMFAGISLLYVEITINL